ncbi:hypothetical protein OXPF_01600 [Oxobacter pfennigii]|uniref:Uncharacterized protein n=1 Tax=Oxobacter pfennigii TaxID=36849 RepID=A0A0P9ALJ3_9CLOT|nr:hypothetical protein OXPF_01600 [Oxobacter pfennigii]
MDSDPETCNFVKKVNNIIRAITACPAARLC